MARFWAIAALATGVGLIVGCGDDDSVVPGDGAAPADAARADGGAMDAARPSGDGGAPGDDAGGSGDGGGAPSDAGGVAMGCGPARLTYYDVVGAGACEVMDVPAALPRIARDGLTAAMAEPWWGGSSGGDPAEACGECWEITTASATRTVVITDLCPIAGNPVCAGDFFHFDVARAAATELGYLTAGIVEADVRRVPCPVDGNIFAIVRDANPYFLRVTFGDARIGIHAVDYRGAGAGVAATNPWTAMHRDSGAWAVTGSGGELARGGTGVVLRLTSSQGQVVESTAIVSTTSAPLTAVDLGVQVDDLAPPTGPACTWRVPDPYVDGLGGIERVRWSEGGWGGGTTDVAATADCRAGTCISVAGLDGWGGLQLLYHEQFAWAGLTRLSLWARAPSEVPLQLKVIGDADCTPVDFMAGPAYSQVTVDLATACAGVSRVQTVQLQLMRATAGSFTVDDVVFE